VKAAGAKGIVLTARYGDGFCLWPTKTTDYSVRSSPWKGGKGDVVRECADACREAGLKFGVYLGYVDNHEATCLGEDANGYGQYYMNQIVELMSNYGEIFELWTDSSAPGRARLDLNAQFGKARQLQPGILCGPPWCGNEAGYARDPLWSPVECDVSIRPGWFYHKDQDERVKSLEELLNIYCASVGRGANLILNVPPDKRGLVHENDAKGLKGLGDILRATFKTNLSATGRATASNTRGGAAAFAAPCAIDGDPKTYWATDDEIATGSLEVDLGRRQPFNWIVIQEDIALGQRVEAHAVDVFDGGEWRQIAEASTIGHKRILRVPKTTASRVRLRITKSRACPAISEFGLYLCPVERPTVGASLSVGKAAQASNQNTSEFGADKAMDDDPLTWWTTTRGVKQAWLQVDLGRPEVVGRVLIAEFDHPLVGKFELQYRDGDTWKTFLIGGGIGARYEREFPPVAARYFRLNILEAAWCPQVREFHLYRPKD
jgi:alpha-L-fucosidase